MQASQYVDARDQLVDPVTGLINHLGWRYVNFEDATIIRQNMDGFRIAFCNLAGVTFDKVTIRTGIIICNTLTKGTKITTLNVENALVVCNRTSTGERVDKAWLTLNGCTSAALAITTPQELTDAFNSNRINADNLNLFIIELNNTLDYLVRVKIIGSIVKQAEKDKTKFSAVDYNLIGLECTTEQDLSLLREMQLTIYNLVKRAKALETRSTCDLTTLKFLLNDNICPAMFTLDFFALDYILEADTYGKMRQMDTAQHLEEIITHPNRPQNLTLKLTGINDTCLKELIDAVKKVRNNLKNLDIIITDTVGLNSNLCQQLNDFLKAPTASPKQAAPFTQSPHVVFKPAPKPPAKPAAKPAEASKLFAPGFLKGFGT